MQMYNLNGETLKCQNTDMLLLREGIFDCVKIM